HGNGVAVGTTTFLRRAVPRDRIVIKHSGVNKIVFSQDGKRLASADAQTIRIWDLKDQEWALTATITLPQFPYDLMFDDTADRITVASMDGTTKVKVSVYDCQAGKLFSSNFLQTSRRSICLIQAGRQIVTQEDNGDVATWVVSDSSTGQVLQRIQGGPFGS